jgi:HPt (histidine-containing phosphotransfer) domain-containing protein
MSGSIGNMAADPSPESPAPSLTAQFEQIRRTFVAGLERREREIDAATDPQTLQAALHRLAGAAGGFGYPVLGELAREALQASETGDMNRLSACLARLKAELRKVATS